MSRSVVSVQINATLLRNGVRITPRLTESRRQHLSAHRRHEEVAADGERDLAAASARFEQDGHGVTRRLPRQPDEADEPGVRVAAARLGGAGLAAYRVARDEGRPQRAVLD